MYSGYAANDFCIYCKTFVATYQELHFIFIDRVGLQCPTLMQYIMHAKANSYPAFLYKSIFLNVAESDRLITAVGLDLTAFVARLSIWLSTNSS